MEWILFGFLALVICGVVYGTFSLIESLRDEIIGQNKAISDCVKEIERLKIIIEKLKEQ